MNNIKRIVNSQSGAALILVLFVVLFLSITGSVLLNATTYSMKSIDRNEIEEAEFYLLEGALDLALDNINNTYAYAGGTEDLYDINGNKAKNNGKQLLINKIGIYFFIQDYLNGSIYTKILDNVIIDDNEIKFTLKSTTTKNVYELTASFVDKSLISSRTIQLEISGPPKPVEDYLGKSRDDYIQTPINLNDNKNIHKNQKINLEGKYLGGINFNNMINKYKLSIPSTPILENLTPNTVIVNSPSYYNEITASTKGTIVIPKDKIIYANSLNWPGQKRTLIVKGTLIIKDFHFQSASTLEMKNTGTIIANSFGIGSNSPNFIFEDNTGGSGSGTSIPKYTSDVDWVVNNYNIINHKTVR